MQRRAYGRYLPDVTQWLEERRGRRSAHRDPNRPALLRQAFDHIAPDEPRAAENRNDARSHDLPPCVSRAPKDRHGAVYTPLAAEVEPNSKPEVVRRGLQAPFGNRPPRNLYPMPLQSGHRGYILADWALIGESRAQVPFASLAKRTL